MTLCMVREPDRLPRLPADQWHTQPADVWRDVERICRAFWPTRVRTKLGVPLGQKIEPGWLTIEIGTYLEALDVPVGRLFTVHALGMRDYYFAEIDPNDRPPPSGEEM